MSMTYIKHCRSQPSAIAPIKHNGVIHTNSIDKAAIINKQFESVFTIDNNDPSPLPVPILQNLVSQNYINKFKSTQSFRPRQ